jgi:hypothetical protein
MEPAVGFVFVLVALALIAVIAGGQRKKIAAALNEVASAHGLVFREHHGLDRRITGLKEGHPVEIRIGAEKANRVLEQTWRIALVAPLPPGFAAGKRGFLSRASAGAVPAPSGDEAFDKQVFVEATHAFGMEQFLTPDRKAALVALIKEGGFVHGDSVYFKKTGLETDGARLRARFHTLWNAVQALEHC